MKTALLTLVVACLTGCHAITYKSGDVSFTRRVFGTQVEFGDLEVTVSTNGSKQIKVKGYSSDQVQALGAVAEGVAKGLGGAVAP